MPDYFEDNEQLVAGTLGLRDGYRRPAGDSVPDTFTGNTYGYLWSEATTRLLKIRYSDSIVPVAAGWSATQHNLAAWAYDPVHSGSQHIDLAGQAGNVLLTRVWAARSGTVVTVRFGISVAAAVIANSFCGLYDASGNRIAQSNNQGTAWQSAGVKSAPFTAGVAITGGNYYYIAWLIGSATTMPFVNGMGGAGNFNIANVKLSAVSNSVSALRCAVLTGAATSLPATIDLTTVTAFNPGVLWGCTSET